MADKVASKPESSELHGASYPRPLGRLLPPIVRQSLGKTGGLLARLALDWTEIAGPRLAAETAPRRLAQSCLTLACSGPVALELQHLSAALLERINRHYGRNVATRLRFVQEPIAPRLLAPGPPPRKLPQARPIENFPAGPLADALASLARHIAHDRHQAEPEAARRARSNERDGALADSGE